METSSEEFILGLESSSSSDSFDTDKDNASRTCLQVQKKVDVCDVQDDKKPNPDIIIAPEVLLFYTSDDENSDYLRSPTSVYRNTGKVSADTDSESNLHNGEESETDPTKCKMNQKSSFPSDDKITNKRKPQPQNWKRNKAALLREKGEAYKSSSGKEVPKKTPNLGMLCRETCPFKCNIKFSKEQREKLFYDFYNLDVNGKNALLYNCISVVSVKRRRKDANKHKSSSYVYTVKNECESVRVCKTALSAIFSISRAKIDHIQKSVKAGHDIPPLDRRGKHMTRPNKLTSEVVDYIKNHIKHLLCQESEYSQAKNDQHTKYSSPFLSLKKMHHLYLNEVRTNDKPEQFHISENTYRAIFNSNF